MSERRGQNEFIRLQVTGRLAAVVVIIVIIIIITVTVIRATVDGAVIGAGAIEDFSCFCLIVSSLCVIVYIVMS